MDVRLCDPKQTLMTLDADMNKRRCWKFLRVRKPVVWTATPDGLATAAHQSARAVFTQSSPRKGSLDSMAFC